VRYIASTLHLLFDVVSNGANVVIRDDQLVRVVNALLIRDVD